VKVEACIVALGGRGNIASSDGVAATRLRVKVKDSSKVDATALADAGIHGAAEVAKRVWHLVVGQEAGAFAGAFASQAAQPAPEEAAAPTA
jgi:PTS system mannose-specific EIIBCA component